MSPDNEKKKKKKMGGGGSESGANLLIYAPCFKYANVAFSRFAPDLLPSIYIFASYLLMTANLYKSIISSSDTPIKFSNKWTRKS